VLFTLHGAIKLNLRHLTSETVSRSERTIAELRSLRGSAAERFGDDPPGGQLFSAGTAWLLR